MIVNFKIILCLKTCYISSIDINECSTNNGDCSHDCENTEGGYYCVCHQGYDLEQDEKTCASKYINDNKKSFYFDFDKVVMWCSVD